MCVPEDGREVFVVEGELCDEHGVYAKHTWLRYVHIYPCCWFRAMWHGIDFRTGHAQAIWGHAHAIYNAKYGMYPAGERQWLVIRRPPCLAAMPCTVMKYWKYYWWTNDAISHPKHGGMGKARLRL
jgi:hypothetical protein